MVSASLDDLVMEQPARKESLDQATVPPKTVSLRRRIALATVVAVAALLSLSRNALLYGWTQGTLLGGVVTIPVGVFLYLFVLRRWSRRGY